jgi:hypothetical protein
MNRALTLYGHMGFEYTKPSAEQTARDAIFIRLTL